ncbi:unnamed protein product [Closterium sp. Naga37s-1]|nr:unnamed protein product [Closterium sp. Naga37s-1]
MLPLMSAASLLPQSLSSRSYLSCLSFLSCVCLWCLSRVSAVGAVAAGPTRSGALQGSTLLLPTSCFLALKACDFTFNGSLGFVPLYSLEAMQPNAPFSDGVLHSRASATVPPPPVPPSLLPPALLFPASLSLLPIH